MMNGHISATGAPGKGATFRFSFPLVHVPAHDLPVHDSATI
jgi:signal transduction histidine kinase